MAESAVSFLIEYLGPLLVDEVKLLKGVRGEARKIRDELESMRAFLRDADAKEDSSESIKAWVRQVRHAAYDTEDILDEFIIHIGQYRQDNRGVFGFVREMAQSIKQLKARHRISGEIQDMRSRLSEIAKRKDDYNLSSIEQVSSLSNLKDDVYDPRVAALFTEESELVGIEGPRARLIGWLLGEEKRLSTMAVVGMGGLGKTTLVKKVYDSEHVKKHFETYAWITVSQTFKKKDILKNMISQFYGAKQEQAPPRVDTVSDIELIQLLRNYLEDKRFVLALDDVWEADAWKFLLLALPARENGSRVILTMRSRDVASSCCVGPSDDIYEPQPLNEKMAWSLFCRRAFPANVDNSCPPELVQLAQSFVNKCRGLPLAIVTLGGLLASKDQTCSVWEMMHHSLGLELESDSLRSMMQILWLSVNDLPYYLKSCYLYLSIFPEDYLIMSQQIIRLWSAEGLIIRREGRTVVEVGESYLDALITRSLVEVSGRKGCALHIPFRVHDLLREIIISKSGKENHFVSSADDNVAVSDRIRRLSIHCKGEIVPKFECSSRLRSLHIFGVYGPSTVSSITSFVAGLQLLRVVNIKNVPMENFPKALTSLLHLRYLDIFNAKIKRVPSSIGKLINLEALILENSYISELPVKICRLQRLQDLGVGNVSMQISHDTYGAKVPSGVGSLTSLQALRRVQADSVVVGELGKLTQLRVLGISKLRREDGLGLCTSLEKMSRLQSLEVTSIGEDEEIDLHSLSHPPTNLQELYLLGHLKMLPHWIATLQNLLVLCLSYSRLVDDPLKALGSLPNLMVLKLSIAYDGEELCVKEGEYPKLTELCLSGLRALKKVVVEKRAMPNLEILSIQRCEALVEVPFWLGHFTNLKRLLLEDMPAAFLKSLQSDEGAERADFIQHISLVTHWDSQAGSNWQF